MTFSEMGQISGCSVCDQLFPLSTKYPWLVSHCLEGEEHIKDQFFNTIHNELPQYQCRIPELLGQRIRGCFHGWVILSNHPNNNIWYLWNQVTSKIISLPTLILEDGEYESIGECCLSAPPTNPSSVLLLTRIDKSTFLYCPLDGKRKKFRWTEMSYAKQLKRLTHNGVLLHSVTCCNGKVYALNSDGTFTTFVIHLDIAVTDNEVVIQLMLFGACPFPPSGPISGDRIRYLKGSSTELFYIDIYLEKEAKKTHKTPRDVYLHKSDMTSINWEERECLKDWDLTDFKYEKVAEYDLDDLDMSQETWEHIDDLKDASFFVYLARDHSVSYRRVNASELGGFIHIYAEMGESVYSYHVKNDTISLFYIPSTMLPTSHLSMWECRLDNDNGEDTCIVDSIVEMENNDEILLRSGNDDGVEVIESHLLNIPLNILETILEFCVGVEYTNFRATCKQCYIAAPLIKWSNETSLRRLQTYSVVSPWLMAADKKRSVVTFTDPVLGDNYFMKYSQLSIDDDKIFYSKFGWLLFMSEDFNCLVFFNPFTNILRKLPELEYSLESICFSAPPTSPDCMVVGFTTEVYWHVDIHFVNQDPTWRRLLLGPYQHTICFSSFYGRDLYALCKGGEVIVFNNLDNEDCSWKPIETKAPKGSCISLPQYFLTNCDQHILLVSVGEYGEAVEVFKHNGSKKEWEKIDGVGKCTIYICDTTCLCIEAKTPVLENKIFFPRLHTKNRKAVFYSLDTCTYHTFDDANVQEHLVDFFGTTYYLSPHVWIEPSWS